MQAFSLFMKQSSDFYDRVLAVVKQIPYGKVTTYGLIAQYLGQKKSARMVGWVLNKQKGKPDIPAHRVVNRKGLLSGKMHFEGTNLMEQLLISEGIPVENNQIVNLDKYLWQPE